MACRTANPSSFLRLVVGFASLLSETANFWSLAIANVIHTTFGGAAGDTFAYSVHLHAVPESCLLLQSGTVTGIVPIGLTCRARLPFVCATTLGVVSGDLQLERVALLLALCRLSNDLRWFRWATWKWEG